jgi:uncharacterized protein (TIGR00725 family)
MDNGKVVSVFGGASVQLGTPPFEEAETLGRLLAQAGYAVMTGGYGGTMEATSKGAKEAGGHVIGVTVAQIERHFGAKRNPYVDEVIHYETLYERLHHLVVKCGAAVAVGGGIGTLSEVALTWSLIQTGEIPAIPLVLLGQRWADTLNIFYGEGEYIRPHYMDLWRVALTPPEVVSILENWK